MEFSLDRGDAQYQITAYKPGSIFVNEQEYYVSVLIMPNMLIAPWEPNSINDLTAAHFKEILSLSPQVFILGTGIKQQFPNAKLFADLYEKQIGVEIMDTAAACRTYTILISEGRRVAAGLLNA